MYSNQWASKCINMNIFRLQTVKIDYNNIDPSTSTVPISYSPCALYVQPVSSLLTRSPKYETNFQGVWSTEKHTAISQTCCNMQLQPNILLLLLHRLQTMPSLRRTCRPDTIHTMVFFGHEIMTMKPIHCMVVL
jgi:hypothetical protein